jgi:hypothetical protein
MSLIHMRGGFWPVLVNPRTIANFGYTIGLRLYRRRTIGWRRLLAGDRI